MILRPLLIAAFLLPMAAYADETGNAGSIVSGSLDGAKIYAQNCQACHMADGKGSHAVITVPALANNPALAQADYPVNRVLKGGGAMIWFNGALSHAQIASVVNYVRTHFGNHYVKPVTEADVTRLAPPVPHESR